MKKLLFIFATVFIINTTYGQKRTTTSSSSYSSSSYGFSKGDFVLSGSFEFSASDGNNGFGFKPSLGYFINDKVLLGASIGYRSKLAKTNDLNPDGFSFDLFGRYYTTPKSQFSLFGQAKLGFVSRDGGGTTIGLGVSPGINYFVSKSFTIEAQFGELGFASTSGNGVSSTSFGLGLNLSNINFGLDYKF
jgi:hypothetical protein